MLGFGVNYKLPKSNGAIVSTLGQSFALRRDDDNILKATLKWLDVETRSDKEEK